MPDIRVLGPTAEVMPGEARLLMPPPRPPICEWIEENLFLPTKETTAPGLFSFHFSPFLREIAECLTDAFVREVTVFACTQGGKTLISYLCLAYTVACNPMHTMIVMPDENTVKRRIAGRVRPIFKANAFLRDAIGGRVENLHIGEATVMPHMNLYLAWARSAAQIADVPVGLILADELGKFPAAVGKEADPMNLLRDRQRTYRGRAQLWKMTSPVDAGDLADQEFEDGDKREFWNRCPYCSVAHIPTDRNLLLDKGPDGDFLPAVAYEEGDHARYLCPSCTRPWNKYDRHEAVRLGRWAPAGCSVDHDGKIVGTVTPVTRRSYRITAFLVNPRFQTIGELAAYYARAQRALKAGNILPLQHFRRSHLAQSWRQREKAPDADRLAEHVGGYDRGLLPAWVQVVTLGIDVQADHIWYAVVGWGYLFEAFLVDAGRVETGDTSDLVNYEAVRQLIARPWPFANDLRTVLPPAQTAIDCGYRKSVVEDFCRQNVHLRAIPVRGDDAVKARVYRKSPVDANLARYHLNVNTIKDRLFRLLFETHAPGPGFFHLPRDTSEEVRAHLTSEEQRIFYKGFVPETIWRPKPGAGANHLWDCCVYATAAAELVGVGRLEAPVVKPTKKPQEQRQDHTGTSFLHGLPRLNQ